MIRQPVAAGNFYPASKKVLEAQIESMSDTKAVKQDALVVVSPHAGYIYSGAVACELFSNIRITDSVIILGPNHTGAGEDIAIYRTGKWRTPIGNIDIDEKLSAVICKNTNLIKNDFSAHMYEHSIETQLPIMQYFKNDFKIVPIIC